MPKFILKVGRQKMDVDSLVEASRMYCKLRDESGLGASEFPEGKISGGTADYRISYNGRVWRGKWFPGQKPLMEAQA